MQKKFNIFAIPANPSHRSAKKWPTIAVVWNIITIFVAQF